MPRLKTLAPVYAYKDLSKALKKGLIDKEMKQIELAERMMVSDSSIGRWIANPEKMTVEQLRSLVVVLGVDMVPVLKALGYKERAIKKMEGKDDD